jgi:hypothetical protein
MIPRDYITAWRAKVPWVEDSQVEQDLIISRALVEMFSERELASSLAFRGGTHSTSCIFVLLRAIRRTLISYRFGREQSDRF